MFKRRGANVIEFALTAPVFFAIILGLVDYGWLFANKAGLDSASSLGCREGSMRDPQFGSPITVAQNQMTQRSNRWCAIGGCTYSVTDQFVVPDRTLVCTVTLNFKPLVGLVPVPTQLTSSSYYRLEWQRPGAL